MWDSLICLWLCRTPSRGRGGGKKQWKQERAKRGGGGGGRGRGGGGRGRDDGRGGGGRGSPSSGGSRKWKLGSKRPQGSQHGGPPQRAASAGAESISSLKRKRGENAKNRGGFRGGGN